MKPYFFQYRRSFVCQSENNNPFVVDIYIRPKDKKVCLVLPFFEWDESGKHATMLDTAQKMSRFLKLAEEENAEWIIASMKNISNKRRQICAKRLEDILTTYNRHGVAIGFNEAVPFVECPSGRNAEIKAVKALLNVIVPQPEKSKLHER